MKFLLTYPIERKKEILDDLELVKKDFSKMNKKLGLMGRIYNKAMFGQSFKGEMVSLTYKEIEKNKIEVSFFIAVEGFINPQKLINGWKEKAEYYGAKMEVLK